MICKGKKKVVIFVLFLAGFATCLTAGKPVRAEEIPSVTGPPDAAAPPAVTASVAPTPTATPVRKVVELSVANAPLELPYGSKLAASQVSLTAQYSDGTAETVNPDDFTVNTNILGKQTVVFTYGGCQVVYNFTVVPRQVTGITMKSGTADSMRVVWDALEEAENYEIYISHTEKGKYSFLAGVTSAEYTFTNLTRGELLYVRIRATSDIFAGAESEVKVIAPKPERVGAVKVTRSESTSIYLEWEKAAGATGYAVYYKLSGKKAYIYAGSVEETAYRVTGLTANKEYQFMVRSFAADISNPGDDSDVATYGTAPAIPVISELKGGDKRLKVYWKTTKGAEQYNIYISTEMDRGFKLAGTAKADATRIYPVDNLVQGMTYYLKIEATRLYKGDTLKAESATLFATTKRAEATSTAAKYYSTLAKFKKSPAYKKYKEFRQQLIYNRSFVLPGMKQTNIGGFNSTKMVPQSIGMAGGYLLISAYDQTGEQESVLYMMDKSTRKYITTIVLPHKGHVGGMAFDGKNLWLSYGKNLQCLKYSVIKAAAKAKKAYVETYAFTVQIPVPDTASYVTYFKNRLWVGTYNENSKKYMYGFTIGSKSGVPTLKQTNKMQMPNRTQGVAVASGGKMIVSRSCQTKLGKSGFLCQLDIYKPTWNLSKKSVKKNTKKKTVQMPPMNEGIVIKGSYTYLVFESPAFSECPAPVDRVVAFKTAKLTKKEK